MKTNYYVLLITIIICVTESFSQNSNKTDLESRKVLILNENINTEHFDGFPMIMPDGLTLYFSSDRPNGLGDLDIYVSHRYSTEDEWQEPINVGLQINSPASDHSVTISNDGHYLYFTSEKAGGHGDADLYVSYRQDITSDTSWSIAKNLGAIINTNKLEACPFFHIDEKETKLYFVSGRDGGLGGMDLYYTLWNDKHKTFENPVALKISSSAHDMHFEPEKGLIWSSREGGVGKHDIWIASFNKDKNIWENPQYLKQPINTEFNEGMPSITKDFSELYFHSNRPNGIGSYDIYIAKKNKNN
ncbi:MAG: hypothetical protein COB01_11715 [Lutibacter sp.]|nr:MAG: hypothetical protein COB01_11715 [Lutibacter sp.]